MGGHTAWGFLEMPRAGVSGEGATIKRLILQGPEWSIWLRVEGWLRLPNRNIGQSFQIRVIGSYICESEAVHERRCEGVVSEQSVLSAQLLTDYQMVEGHGFHVHIKA